MYFVKTGQHSGFCLLQALIYPPIPTFDHRLGCHYSSDMLVKTIGWLFTSVIIFAGVNGDTHRSKSSNAPKNIIIDSTVNFEGSKFIGDPKHVGLSIGIYNKGATTTYNFGTIIKGRHILPTANNIYEMGSITKSFMGLLLARAAIDKKVNLNDEVTKYLEGNYPGLSFAGKPVKIINLANHTAGFPKNIPDLSHLTPTQVNELFKTYNKQHFLTDLAKFQIKTTPGSAFQYSNAGTQVAAIIVEKIYRDSFANLLKKYITQPNHMYHTGTIVSGANEKLYVKGYDGNGLEMPRPDLWKTLPAAGYLKSSVNDMLKYIRLNIAESTHPEVKLAHTPTFVHTDEDDADIGLFWFVKNNARGQREVMHAGGSFGTTSFVLIAPDQKKGIICFANDASAGTEHELRVMAEKILSGM